MKPAAELMKGKINSIKFNKPSIQIVTNVTAEPEINSENIKSLLIEQISSTVKWRESIINMHKAGVKNFIEIAQEKP